MLNEGNLREGERFLTEQEIEKSPFNEQATGRFAPKTKFRFRVETTQRIGKKTKNGENLIFVCEKKADGGEWKEDFRFPAAMALRMPFLEENRKPLQGITKLQDALLEAKKASNPGLEVWRLFRNRVIIVLKDVEALDRPFGKDAEENVRFNIFDYDD